ncbi:winged helix-turn-helix domain-containing protein [Kineosporia babensis]|uniref:Winged helix-turn-helix domain-containing protein n=1 Tax=Kineosporia babensis TaxID=499548 RepID=A0A9X1SXI8_9ACTN|nr:winged helix-turn-helix domain-containing protein [Kineosporia babensis]MCD5315879.1 winged helix-turn-helix domain-containing protein [Kineosporia babensis]
MSAHDADEDRMRLDPATGLLHGPAGTTALTAKEQHLLTALLHGRGQVVARHDLLQALWDVTRGGASRTLDVHIATLRTKLHATGGPRIETVRGTGYRLLPPGPDTAATPNR